MLKTKNKNEIISKLDNKKPLKLIKNRYAEILVSLGGKKIGPEGKLNESLLRELKKHQPKQIIIHVVDEIQAFNWFLMVSYITDEDLTARLQDIPDNIDEINLVTYFANKFKDITLKLGDAYINNLQKYFEENQVIKDLKIPFTIKRWDTRKTTNNYLEKNIQIPTELSNENKNASEFQREATTKRFLTNKKKIIDDAIKRIIKIKPCLAQLNWDKVTKRSSEEFINKEIEYFECLHDTDIIYPAKIPPAFESTFEKKELNLYWREVVFKKRNIEKMQEELQKLQEKMGKTDNKDLKQTIAKNPIVEDKHRSFTFANTTTPKLYRTQSACYIMDQRGKAKNITNESLAERRHFKFFEPLNIWHTSEETVSTPVFEIKSPNRTIIINTAKTISPKSEKKLLEFISLFCKSPRTPERDKALQQKLDEATALFNA